jgi:hypothetical protein
MTANYRQIRDLLAERKPFKGNSMSAELKADGDYFVRSYSTIIASVVNGEVYVSDTHYSRTTSRHQGLCRTYL